MTHPPVMGSILAALALTLTLGAAARADVPPQAYGDWKGSANVGTGALRLALHLGATSTMDSPDQNAMGLPAASVSNGRHLTLTVAGVGVIEGDLSEDGQSLSMVVRQGAGVPVVLTRGTFAAPARPQNPAPPFPYAAREVAFDNPALGGGRLAGTLTTPNGAGPFPAVVLITGSGAQDRDESLAGHKPFLVLADALTRRGVAVLRLDDRGVGGSARGGPNDTDRDFATDTEAALAWLRTQPQIDRTRLGLIGHSAGGAIAPMVAQQDPGVAFMVLWAGPAVNGVEIISEQTRQANLAARVAPNVMAANVALEREILTAVSGAATAEAVGPAVGKVYADHSLPPPSPQVVASFSSAWYRNFLSYDPAPALRALRVPVLAVVGEKDTQVSAEQNIPALRAALAGDPQAMVVSLPGLNHLLQPAATGLTDEYATIEITIDPAALKLMVDWVAKTAGL